MKFLRFSQTKLGSSLSLPAHGLGGARATLLFLAAHFAKRNTKNCGEKRSGESEGGRKILPPTPLPFCPPERKLSKFSVRIFVKKSSNINQKTPPIFKLRLLGDCCLAPPEAGFGFGEDFEGIFEVAKQFLPA